MSLIRPIYGAFCGLNRAARPYATPLVVKAAMVVTLIAWPFGSALAFGAYGGETPANEFWTLAASMALLLLPAVALIAVTPRQIHRITGDRVCGLDVFEADQRRRAFAFAHKVFAAGALIGVAYLAAASGADAGWWTPTRPQHWVTILMSMAFYAVVLPTAYLAWTMRPPADEDA